MKNKKQPTQHSNVRYQNDDSNVYVGVYYNSVTARLIQRVMAGSFGCITDKSSLDLKNFYAEGELKEKVTIEFFSAVQKKSQLGGGRQYKFSNDPVIAVGYRANMHQVRHSIFWPLRH